MNETNYTVSDNVAWSYPKEDKTCPHCGYCPTCGRGGFHTYPYPYYPSWPYQPTITWGNTGTMTVYGTSENS